MSDRGTRENVISDALAAGHRVVYGHPMTLQLDIDDEAALERARALLKQFKSLLDYSNVTMARSKSEKWHLYVHLRKMMDRKERYLMQALLGSDPAREILNWSYTGNGECFFIEISSDESLFQID